MKPLDWLRAIQSCQLDDCEPHRGLKSGDIALAAGLIRWANIETATCNSSWAQLTTASRLSRPRIPEHMKNLERLGWLQIRRTRGRQSLYILTLPRAVDNCWPKANLRSVPVSFRDGLPVSFRDGSHAQTRLVSRPSVGTGNYEGGSQLAGPVEKSAVHSFIAELSSSTRIPS